MLSLAGLEVPKAMQGQVLLGPKAAPEAEYVYGFRDRVDEVFDLSRSIRSKDYLYIRNYLPHLPGRSWASIPTKARSSKRSSATPRRTPTA